MSIAGVIKSADGDIIIRLPQKMIRNYKDIQPYSE